MSSQCARETDRTSEHGNEHHDSSDCSWIAGKFSRGAARTDSGREQPTKRRIYKARSSSGQNASSYAASGPCSEVSSAEVDQVRTKHEGGIRKAEDTRSRRVEDENCGC